jgi:hypothetical protein
MLFWCYLDESSDGHHNEAFVAAGFVGTAEAWVALEKPWKAKLDEHGLKYFKSRECRNLQKEFCGYKQRFGLEGGRRKAYAVRDELEEIVEQSSIFGFAMGIDLKAFNEVNQSSEAKASAYWTSDYFVLAYRMAFFQITAEIHQNPTHPYIAFVCDQSSKERKLNKAYQEFKAHYPVLATHLRGISHLDDKDRWELQVADLMADIGRSHITKRLADPSYQLNLARRAVRVDCLQRRGMIEILKGNAKGT